MTSPAPSSNSKRPLWITLGVLAVIALAVAAEAIFSSSKTERVGSAPSSTFVPLPPSRLAPAAACEEAPADMVTVINSGLNGAHLEAAQAVRDGTESTYVGGNIVAADGGIRHAETFLVQDAGVYAVFALSHGAREASTWPDGGDIADVGFRQQVVDCVTG